MHPIDSLAEGQKVRARGFSYSSQLYTLMLGQFLHAFSLNELVDISEVHRAELSRIRGISPAKRNTFSNANRTRDPKVAEGFYWALRDHLCPFADFPLRQFRRAIHHETPGNTRFRRACPRKIRQGAAHYLTMIVPME